MSARERITATLRELLDRQLASPIEATWESDIQRDLGLDSLKQLALIVEIENTFEIAFEPEDDQARTVGQVVETIERLLEAKQK